MHPDGTHLLRVARDWFDEETVARVFEPLIADWQREPHDRTRASHARWLLRGYLSFAASFMASLPRQLQRRQPDATMLSGWFTTEGFAVAGIYAQLYLFFGDVEPLRGAKYLLPGLLATALPLALVPAAIIVFGVRRARPAEARAMVLRLALLVFLVTVPLVGWIAPLNNQAWRDARLPALSAEYRGVRELTLTELVRPTPPADLHVRGVTRDQELENRGSILLMPFTLTVLGLTIAAGSRRLFLAKALLWWIAVGLVWASLTLEGWWLRDWALGFWAGLIEKPYWIFHIIALGAAATLQWRNRRRPASGPLVEAA